MKTLFVSAALASLLAVGLNAQTVTVAKTGTPDFATVQAAIDNFDPDPDGGTPNVIQITDGAVYDEIITIDVPVTIEGTGVDRPILAVQLNTGSDGIVISVPTGTDNEVTLRNLIVVPSLTAPPNVLDASDGIISIGQNLSITIDNCVVTANDGTDNPVTVDGITPAVAPVGSVYFGDDGMFLGGTAAPAGVGTSYTLVNTVVSHIGDPSIDSAGGTVNNSDGIVASGTTGGTILISDGCVFSYCKRLGIQMNGNFTLDAPNDNVLVLNNGGFAGIWFAGTGAATARVINGVDVIGTTGVHNTGIAFGIEHQNAGGIPFTLTDAVIAGNSGAGLAIQEVGTTGPITISDVTIAGNGGNSIQSNAAATSTIDIQDAIVSGGAGIVHDGTGTFDIAFSALVSQTIGGATAVTQSNVINDPITFADTNNPASADFYDIILITGDPSPYLTAASDGGILTGGAGSKEVTITSVPHYELYR
jgi:hypothetical protein